MVACLFTPKLDISNDHCSLARALNKAKYRSTPPPGDPCRRGNYDHNHVGKTQHVVRQTSCHYLLCGSVIMIAMFDTANRPSPPTASRLNLKTRN